MSKITLVFFIFFFLILWSISDVFSGDCVNKKGIEYSYKRYTCEKIGSTYCYFPKSGYPTHAFFYSRADIPEATIPDTKFHEKHGGCHLSIDYPQDRIRANFNNNVRVLYIFVEDGIIFLQKWTSLMKHMAKEIQLLKLRKQKLIKRFPLVDIIIH